MVSVSSPTPNPPSTDERLWTCDDVAAYLQMSTHTVRNWQRDKKIPFRKVNGLVRFIPTEIRAWATGQA